VTKQDLALYVGVGILGLSPVLAAVFQVAQGSSHAHPVADWALLQIQVHEAVNGAALLGPYSRFGWHHPGPLLAYLMAPGYWASGHSPTSLHVTASLSSLASLLLACTAWFRIARDETHRLLFLVLLGAHCVNFALGWRHNAHAEIWNPIVALMPFTSLLIVSVAATAGAPTLLPAAYFLHALASQTHIEYALPATAAVALATGSLAFRARRRAPRTTWIGSALVAAACWYPTVYDAVANHGGNAAELVRSFLHSSANDRSARWASAGLQFSAPLTKALTAIGPSRGIVAAFAAIFVISIAVAVVFAHVRFSSRLETGSPTRSLLIATELQLAVAAFCVWRLPGEPHWYLFLWLKAVLFVSCLSLAMVAARTAWFSANPERSHALRWTALGLVGAATVVQIPGMLWRSSTAKPRSLRTALELLDCLQRKSGVRSPFLNLQDADAWRVGAAIALHELEQGRTVVLKREERYRFGNAFEYTADARAASRFPTIHVAGHGGHRRRSMVPLDRAYVSVDVHVDFGRVTARPYLDDAESNGQGNDGRALVMTASRAGSVRLGLFPGLPYRAHVRARSVTPEQSVKMEVIVNDYPLMQTELTATLAEYDADVPASLVAESTIVRFRFEDGQLNEGNGSESHVASPTAIESMSFVAVMPSECVMDGVPSGQPLHSRRRTR